MAAESEACELMATLKGVVRQHCSNVSSPGFEPLSNMDCDAWVPIANALPDCTCPPGYKVKEPVSTLHELIKPMPIPSCTLPVGGVRDKNLKRLVRESLERDESARGSSVRF